MAQFPNYEDQRRKLINEFYSSEQAHLQSLNIAVVWYLAPLRSNDILSEKTINEIFLNLELIRNWHAAFVDELNARQDNDNFGRLFMEMIPVYRQLFNEYNEKYDHAVETYEKAKKKKKDFAHFLEKTQKEVEGSKDLLTYLYLPVNRVMAYHSMLKEIHACTPPNHPDYQYITNALAFFQEMQDYGTFRASQRKNIDKVIEIQNRIADTTTLALPHRRFIYEGEVHRIKGSSKKERYCFLFNDLFLCCKKKGNQLHKNQLEVDFKEPLGTLRVDDVTESDAKGYLFVLTSPTSEYTLSSNDKYHWITMIKQQKEAVSDDQNIEDKFSKDILLKTISQWAKAEAPPEAIINEIRNFVNAFEQIH